MLSNYIIILLCCCVYTALSASNFIGKYERAKYFEITDNEVPVVRVNLPQDEFLRMKAEANKLTQEDLEKKINELILDLRNKISVLKELNFNETFPGSNINEILPQLEINQDGFASFDDDEILNEFDLDPKSYEEDDFSQIDKHFLESNDNFNINKIMTTMSSLHLADGIDLDKLFNSSSKGASNQMKKINLGDAEKFKTKNATVTVEINGKKKTYKKTTFSLGGIFSSLFSKPSYNLNIRGGDNLYGRKQFKIRSDGEDPSFLRIKLMSDIRNRLGFPSVSASFIQLYINDQFMGFYIMSDAFKKSWIEYVYDEEDPLNLYQCNNMRNVTLSNKDGCVNENDDVTDQSEWESFLTIVENAQSPEDLEDIFEIDYFLKDMALDYITGSIDHIVKGHNYYFYKQPNGKWIYLSYDFDLDFGIFFNDLLKTSYAEFFGQTVNLLNVLIFKDTKRFEKALKEVVEAAVNPSVLFPYIDELKEFIKPYVVLEKTPDEYGRYPGRLNKQGLTQVYSLDQWDAYSEFTSNVFDVCGYTYGLKYWILMKYRLVCNEYGIGCDPVYMDENYEYPINKELNFSNGESIYIEDPLHPPTKSESSTPMIESVDVAPPTSTVITDDVPAPTIDLEDLVPVPTIDIEDLVPAPTIDLDEDLPTSTIIPDEEEVITVTVPAITLGQSQEAIKCYAELIGYTCCPDDITTVYDHDEYGDWSYDYTNQVWCGLTPYENTSKNNDECWSEIFGYPCCKGCYVVETDDDGSWGSELNQWCGIPSYCKSN